jgi:hypothetical protein
MTRYRTLQDAGREQPLSVGEDYDLSDLVAQSLIATGAAVCLEARHPVVPEAKPMAPPERKKRSA